MDETLSILRRRFVCVIVAAVCFPHGDSPVCAADASRPNVVLIMADDLGYSDLGCYGGEIRTPHLDRMAKEGMQFTQFYNCPVCTSTRAALLTGLYPRRAGDGQLRDDMITLAELLRDAGYRTSLSGKWHLGRNAPNRPNDRGFEEYYGLVSGCCNFFNPALRDPDYEGGAMRPFSHNGRQVTEFPKDFYATDAFTDHAIKHIRQYAKRDAPFFVHVCYTAPHSPLHAKPADIARYKGKYDEGYFRLREDRFRRQKRLGVIDPRWRLSPVDRKLGPFRYDYNITPWEDVRDLAREKRRMEVYAAMVDSVDQGVGRIMAALAETGVADNTLVMFLSDNGGSASYPEAARKFFSSGSHKLPGGVDTYDYVGPGWGWAQCAPFRRYKVWTYEGGISTPMIAHWPRKIAAGSRTDEIAHVIDFMPTLAELAGVAYPTSRGGKKILPVEGLSLVDTLRGRKRKGHDAVYWQLWGGRAIRQHRWKLLWGITAKKWELYNMHNDRTETEDLAGQHPTRVRQMSGQWEAWARRTR